VVGVFEGGGSDTLPTRRAHPSPAKLDEPVGKGGGLTTLRRVLFEIHQTIKMHYQAVFQALADPTRREILKKLTAGSLSAGELASAFSITKGSMSHHFNVLKAAELVRSERRGQSIVYSLNTSVFEDVAAMLLDLFQVRMPKLKMSKKLESSRR
jgi:ArsR family transcriptional regulator, arsenate/arsenite/antimonite-responsive transcriptional repressor